MVNAHSVICPMWDGASISFRRSMCRRRYFSAESKTLQSTGVVEQYATSTNSSNATVHGQGMILSSRELPDSLPPMWAAASSTKLKQVSAPSTIKYYSSTTRNYKHRATCHPIRGVVLTPGYGRYPQRTTWLSIGARSTATHKEQVCVVPFRVQRV